MRVALAMETLRLICGGLFAVNAKPHEHKTDIVGASCLLFLLPALLSRVMGDQWNFWCLLVVTLCSLSSDYLYIGTIWNVIDRWVASPYTLLLSFQCFWKVPVLTA